MIPEKFLRLLNRRIDKLEITPVGYVDHPLGRIFIAEGWQQRRPYHENGLLLDLGAGWTVWWHVDHKGICGGAPMYVSSHARPDQRKAAAIDAAARYLETYHGSNAA